MVAAHILAVGTYYEKGLGPTSNAPAGRIMSVSDTTIYGYGRQPHFWGGERVVCLDILPTLGDDL